MNYAPSPLVSIILVTHDGDVHLLSRALQSIYNQDLPKGQIELLIYFDGKPNGKEEKYLNSLLFENEAFDKVANQFWNVQFFNPQEKNGYYCVGRNHMTAAASGFYIYNMDADNEIAPNHLSGLLEAIRQPHGDEGFPHFTYSRRKYIVDESCINPPNPDGTESTLVEWTAENVQRLRAPAGNFVDTGDALWSKSALFYLADRTGFIWNPQCRRFGDWDLLKRAASIGYRGKAIDQITHLYHWTGKNLQLTRRLGDVMAIPERLYDKLKAEGKMIA